MFLQKMMRIQLPQSQDSKLDIKQYGTGCLDDWILLKSEQNFLSI